jgi:hypothetical protein
MIVFNLFLRKIFNILIYLILIDASTQESQDRDDCRISRRLNAAFPE